MCASRLVVKALHKAWLKQTLVCIGHVQSGKLAEEHATLTAEILDLKQLLDSKQRVFQVEESFTMSVCVYFLQAGMMLFTKSLILSSFLF